MKNQITILKPTKETNGLVAYRTNNDRNRVSIIKMSFSGRNNGVAGFINPSGEVIADKAVLIHLTDNKINEVVNNFN